MAGRGDTWNTHAIVLHYQPWRDFDRLYTVYTEQLGKQTLRAHGVRRPRAKLAGALEPFAEIDLYGIPAKYFSKVGGAVVTQRFGALTKTLARLNAALYCCDVLARLTKDNVPDQAIYQLVYSTLVWLNRQPPSRLITTSYTLKLIELLGFGGAVLATLRGDQVVAAKIIRWMTEQPFHDIQKLRLSDPDWQNLQSALQQWLYEYLGDDVQSAKFLVY
jgi:DNA repair protein RecO (recombination protein O)